MIFTIKLLVSLLFLVFTFTPVFSNKNKRRVLLEHGYYPAGSITSIGVEDGSHFGFLLGKNIARRQDFGKNEREEGEGYGFSIFYLSSFSDLLQNFGNDFLRKFADNIFIGARVDYWDLRIYWEDGGEKGYSDIIVFQPTAELGVQWDVFASFKCRFSVAGGIELNLIEDGRPVGQGPIGLVRFAFLNTWD